MDKENLKVMIAIDRSGMDQTLYEYMLSLAKNVSVQECYLLHVVRDFEDIAPPSKGEVQDVPVDEQILHDIVEDLPDGISDFEHLHIEIHEGPIIKSILKWAKIKDIDILIIGNKEDKYHEDYLPSQVANFSKCSVAMVPEHVKIKDIKNILVPIDFSPHAAYAVTASQVLKKDSNVELVNFYEVPPGYHTIGKSFEEFSSTIRKQHEREFNEFMDKNQLDSLNLDCQFELDKDGNIPKAISEYASSNNMDAVIIGAKGRTHLASMLIGSVAKKLIQISQDIPVIVIKEKHDEYNLAEGLWDI